MIELTLLQIADPRFQQAVHNIWDCPMLDGQTSYSAYRVKQGIDKANKTVRDMRIALTRKWGKKDENGALLNDPNGRIMFEKPEDESAFEEDFTKEFAAKKLTLKVSKIDFQKLQSVRGLTPASWEFLAPILDNLPPLEDEEAPQVEAPPEEIPKKKKKRELSPTL